MTPLERSKGHNLPGCIDCQYQIARVDGDRYDCMLALRIRGLCLLLFVFCCLLSFYRHSYVLTRAFLVIIDQIRVVYLLRAVRLIVELVKLRLDEAVLTLVLAEVQWREHVWLVALVHLLAIQALEARVFVRQ